MYEERHAAENKAEPKKEEKPLAAEAETIGIEDFAKVRLKIGKITACERMANSKKLLKNTVVIGAETRTILSGIAKWYTPEEMVGKTVVVVSNLKPARLAGEMSEGMLLCAEDDGNVVLLTAEKEGVPGSSIS